MFHTRYGDTILRATVRKGSGIYTIGRNVFEIRLSSSTVPRGKGNKTNNTATRSETQASSQSPLSTMPINMLIRSLFVNTISSNRFLLTPSLHLLSFFSKANRSLLFNVDRNPVLKAVLKKTMYNQFCAGETEKETRTCVRQLKDLGFRGVILTYAREMVFDNKTSVLHHSNGVGELSSSEGVEAKFDNNIEEWRVGTLKTLELIDGGDILAIKTSGAGPSVVDAFTKGKLLPQQMLDALDEIATTCKERRIQIIVDAESQHFQKGIACTTLELMRKFNRDGFAVIYNTYQAYLKGTPAVLARHLAEASKDCFTLGLKLVRGAYMLSDDRSLIHDTKKDTDDAYNGIACGALCQHIGDFGGDGPGAQPFPSVNLFLASHNRESVLTAHRLHHQRLIAGRPTVPVAFGQLHGMSDEVSFSLLREQGEDENPPDVFKCSTWGSMGECVGYLVRRAAENRDAVLRTNDEYTALKSEAKRRLRSLLYV